MKIRGHDKLEEFTRKHTDARGWSGLWISVVEDAKWGKFQDIKSRYPSASHLHPNWVIFNVKGNEYRLEVKVLYKTGVVRVEWVGTHEEYNRRSRERRG